jgi:hypothetical protein
MNVGGTASERQRDRTRRQAIATERIALTAPPFFKEPPLRVQACVTHWIVMAS